MNIVNCYVIIAFKLQIQKLLFSISLWFADNIIENNLSINEIMIEIIKETTLIYINNEKTIMKEYKIDYDTTFSSVDIHETRKQNIKVMSLYLSQINNNNFNEIFEIITINDYSSSTFWEILPILIGLTYNVSIQIYSSNIENNEESEFVMTYIHKSKIIAPTISYNLQRRNIILIYLDYRDQYLLLEELDYHQFTIANKQLGKVKADGSCCSKLLENIQIIGERKRGVKAYSIAMFCFEQINETQISRKMHLNCIKNYFSK